MTRENPHLTTYQVHLFIREIQKSPAKNLGREKLSRLYRSNYRKFQGNVTEASMATEADALILLKEKAENFAANLYRRDRSKGRR